MTLTARIVTRLDRCQGYCKISERFFHICQKFYFEEEELTSIVPGGDHRCGHVSVSQGLLVIQIEICGQFLKFIALPFTEILKHKLTDKFNFVKNVKFYFEIIRTRISNF